MVKKIRTKYKLQHFLSFLKSIAPSPCMGIAPGEPQSYAPEVSKYTYVPGAQIHHMFKYS